MNHWKRSETRWTLQWDAVGAQATALEAIDEACDGQFTESLSAYHRRASGYHLTLMFVCGQEGWTDALDRLLSLGVSPDKGCKEDKMTPLMAAAHSGRAKAADLLLTGGADALRMRLHDGYTCLHAACDGKNLAVLVALIEHLRNLHPKDKDSQLVPLDFLLSTRYRYPGTMLERGVTPLYAAVLLNNVELVRYLLSVGSPVCFLDRLVETKLPISLFDCCTAPKDDPRQREIVEMILATNEPVRTADHLNTLQDFVHAESDDKLVQMFEGELMEPWRKRILDQHEKNRAQREETSTPKSE